jgi:hypothetical protein
VGEAGRPWLIDLFSIWYDPSDVILKKLEMNEKKYPVEKAKGSAEKYTKY